MSQTITRSTIYFEADLHQALRMKAASTRRSVSELVNEAVRAALADDQEDLSAVEERASEPTMSYEDLLNELKAHGRI